MRVRRRERGILRQLQGLYDVGTMGTLTDGQLLERFATDGDEVAELAFAALVERHEAMVWRVCLAVLREEHEAEDAFQATFLVLVRKARSLWVRDSLGPWLHQVACRTAACLRATIIRRRKHEQRSAERNTSRVVGLGPENDPDRDAAVHEEVNRLPEKYRAPLVLCDLEGRTHQEAARFLGWPIGTVKSRQSQARGLVRDRLARRGVGLAVAGAAVESMRQAAVGGTLQELSQKTVGAAMRLTNRLLPAIAASEKVLSLTQGAVRGMLWNQLRFLAIGALAVGIVPGGAMIYLRSSQEPKPKEVAPASKQPTRVTAQGPPTTATPTNLRAQQLRTRRAKVVYEIASLNRQLAGIAVEEYEDVIYPRELAAAEHQIEIAKADVDRGDGAFKKADPAPEKSGRATAMKISAELALKKAQFSLEQAQSVKKVLVEYTRDKTIKELKSEIDKAGSEELAAKANWSLEVAKEKKLERELKDTGRK